MAHAATSCEIVESIWAVVSSMIARLLVSCCSLPASSSVGAVLEAEDGRDDVGADVDGVARDFSTARHCIRRGVVRLRRKLAQAHERATHTLGLVMDAIMGSSSGLSGHSSRAVSSAPSQVLDGKLSTLPKLAGGAVFVRSRCVGRTDAVLVGRMCGVSAELC
eukprot:scaffold5170_cov376-Prasinococcus_capsulatus_cf.AAC.1